MVNSTLLSTLNFLMMAKIDSTKCSVRFAPKDSMSSLKKKPTIKSLIMLHFNFEGERMKFSTGYKASYSDWNKPKQRFKTGKADLLIADEANEHLSNLETGIKKEYARMKAEGQSIDKDVLKGVLDQLSNSKKDVMVQPEELGFWEIYDEFLDLKGKRVKPITLRAHKQTLSRLKEFESNSKIQIDFDSINLTFYEMFTQYLKTNSYRRNTIGKHIKNLKVFMNYALLEDYTTNKRFKRSEFKVQSEQTVAIYLTDEEIQKMQELDLSYNKNYERARDIFLIGCYTGQRVSDYNNLSSNNMVLIDGEQFLKIKQKKTGEIVDVLLVPEIKDIFKRYGNVPPKRMPEQKLNNYIKDVGRIAGIDQLLTVENPDSKDGSGKEVPKYRLITSHTARRSFCTNYYKRGRSIEHIMHFSGHKSEKEFRKYIRIEGEEKASHLVQSGFFNLER